MNDFTTNGIRPVIINNPTYNDLLNQIRETIDVQPDIRRINNLLLNLVNEIRNNPVTENIIVRELKDTVYYIDNLPNKNDQELKDIMNSMQNFIQQLDPSYLTQTDDGRHIVQAPAKAKQSYMSNLDREIELAIADGDDEELAILMKKKQEEIEALGLTSKIDSEALRDPLNEKQSNNDTNYSLNGLNLSEEAINALNGEFGANIVENKPIVDTEVKTSEILDWNEVKKEVAVTDEVVNDVVEDKVEYNEIENKRQDLLRQLAELDRTSVPVSEPVVEKSDINIWEDAFKIAKEDKHENIPLEKEVPYVEMNNEITEVKSEVIPAEEIHKVEEVEENTESKLQNLKHEVMDVNDFDKYLKPLSKVPNENMLTSFRGSRTEKIKAYRDAHKSGRKIYLPDSGYEVFIYKIRDRQQLNYIYLLLEEAGYGSNLVQRYEIDELIRIVADHVDFDFDNNPDKTEFLYNISPRDFSLLVIMFAIINSPEQNDKHHPTAKVDRCTCSVCGNKAFLKEDVALDLYESFVNSYPFDKFIRGYNDYLNNKPADIVLAYRKPGQYGELHKVTAEDDLFSYKLVFSKPTIGKIQNKERNQDDIIYKLLLQNFTERYDMMSEVPHLATIDNIIAQCPDWISFKDYSKDFINDYRLDPENPDFKATYNAVKYISDQLEVLEENNNGLLNLTTWVDFFVISTKSNEIEPEEFNHEDLFELFTSIIDAPTELIAEAIKTIDSFKDLTGVNASAVELSAEFVKSYLSFDKTYFTDEEAMKRFEAAQPDAAEERKNKFVEDRKEMRATMDDGKCPICKSTEFVIEYPQLLFFSIASRLRQKTKN